MRKINILALDENFDIITPLAYENLQWNRKFFECGWFSVEFPLSQYNKKIKYIYTKDRKELGVVSQFNYHLENGISRVNLSGYFLEKELDRMIVYAKGDGNIISPPVWTMQKGKAEDVALKFFDDFKKVVYNNSRFELDIDATPSKGRGNHSEHSRNNEELGHKLYKILKFSEMSYRINFDFVSKKKMLEIWKGVDRTSGNAERNNPVTFGTNYGNVDVVDLLLSDTKEKTAYIATNSYTEGKVEKNRVIANVEGDVFEFLHVDASLNKDDYSSTTDFNNAIRERGHEEVLKNKPVLSFNFVPVLGSYEYMEDFELGDICTVEVPEVEISKSAILTGCLETIKEEQWILTMEFEVI